MLRNQVIVAGMGDVLGINHLAIHAIFGLYGITDQVERQILFEKILAVDEVVQEFNAKRSAAAQPAPPPLQAGRNVRRREV